MIKVCHFPNAYNNIKLTLATKLAMAKKVLEICIFYPIMKKKIPYVRQCRHQRDIIFHLYLIMLDKLLASAKGTILVYMT